MIKTILFVAVVIGLTGCIGTSDTGNTKSFMDSSRNILRRDVKGHLIYFYDSSVKICFAYMWAGQANGGPALTTVPCSDVMNSARYVGDIQGM